MGKQILNKAGDKLAGNNINILNVARAELSKYNIGYEDRIPVATQKNIQEIYQRFSEEPRVRNQLATALIGLIGKQTINTDVWVNPFEEVKKSPMRFGMTEQEIFVNMAKGRGYDPLAGADRAFAIYRAYVMAVYHHVNHEEQYAVTVSWDDLRTSFLTENGLQSLTQAKIQSLTTGANWDEYLVSKALIDSAWNAGVLYPVKTTRPIDNESTLNFLTDLQEYAGLVKFPLPQYNAAGATSSVQDVRNLVLITTPRVDALIKVRAQAWAFNERFLTDPTRKIIVDSFDDPDIIAVLVDIRWFNIRDHYRVVDQQHNGASHNTNHFLTVAGMYSYSPFFPAFVFAERDTSVTGITIADATVARGSETTLEIDVTGTNPLKTYDLELTGNFSVRTVIVPGTNILLVGQDETATTLQVKATSLYDSSLTATATITVTD